MYEYLFNTAFRLRFIVMGTNIPKNVIHVLHEMGKDSGLQSAIRLYLCIILQVT